MLPPGCRAGAPAAIAARAVVTGSSTSYRTAILAAARRAISGWPAARPSTVRMSLSCAWPAATRQAHTVTPSMITVHEPHSPCSQAFLLPGRPSLSRSTYRRLSPSQASPATRCSTLTVQVTRITLTLPFPGTARHTAAAVPGSPAMPSGARAWP